MIPNIYVVNLVYILFSEGDTHTPSCDHCLCLTLCLGTICGARDHIGSVFFVSKGHFNTCATMPVPKIYTLAIIERTLPVFFLKSYYGDKYNLMLGTYAVTSSNL